ncbi:hypothetical protein A374_04234 [Fictibacillus macauensis ZFHKF-1]|uniref:STAS domain-containing protein n=1 Tax=Fictibacillus macauensis ZFHKF-1 TaxID=1196324 RepID=I8J4P4_9BACL|nr:STAS domain-containing protein [Fictibacillus macauensis]EIT86751.1 hypothetical protein A374_04234 [Fictibacillus macauensis ZFHKF-1]
MAIKHMPIPYFEIDKQFNILARSDQSVETFLEKTNFLELVDAESKEKASLFLLSPEYHKEIELVLHTIATPFALFSCSIQWHEDVGHLVCLEQSEKLKVLEEKVQHQSERLAQTNFELFEQKEQLEKSLKRVLELSAHFVHLSKSVGLVPFTGDLNEALITENKETLIQLVYDGALNSVFFDFSSVEKLTASGFEGFCELIRELNLVGALCYVVGLKPEHAMLLKNKNIQDMTYFMRNLNEVIHVDSAYSPERSSLLLQ